jgi:hypothetical protein
MRYLFTTLCFFVLLPVDKIYAQADTTNQIDFDNFQDELMLLDTAISENFFINDLEFYADNLLINDGILETGDLHADFQLLDSANLDVIQVELAVLDENRISVISTNTFSFSDLETAGYIENMNVDIVFAQVKSGFYYRLSILIRKEDGTESSVLTKLYSL